MITETYPLKWLLEQLPNYIAPEALAELLRRFEVQKQRYSHNVKINDLERRLRYEESPVGRKPNAERIASLQAKLQKRKHKQASDE
ncbi:MAG: hypothetical protein IPK75_17970 [Acidobacteria bacterium]|nr:hypothetical protein [Acidobacteriota bacterium]